MYSDRQHAFKVRIDELLTDAQRAGRYRFKHHDRFDLISRILSALEDAYQLGRREAAGVITIQEKPDDQATR